MKLLNWLDLYSSCKSQAYLQCKFTVRRDKWKKKFTSWNGFPKSILISIIKLALNKFINDNYTSDDNDTIPG